MEDRLKKGRADDKLPKLVAAGLDSRAYTAREAWQLFAIMSEFVEATERLNQVRPAVSIFGSAHAARSSLLRARRAHRAPLDADHPRLGAVLARAPRLVPRAARRRRHDQSRGHGSRTGSQRARAGGGDDLPPLREPGVRPEPRRTRDFPQSVASIVGVAEGICYTSDVVIGFENASHLCRFDPRRVPSPRGTGDASPEARTGPRTATPGRGRRRPERARPDADPARIQGRGAVDAGREPGHHRHRPERLDVSADRGDARRATGPHLEQPRPHRRPRADVEDPAVVNSRAGCPSIPRSPKPSLPPG